jgi:hypothetical protein
MKKIKFKILYAFLGCLAVAGVVLFFWPYLQPAQPKKAQQNNATTQITSGLQSAPQPQITSAPQITPTPKPQNTPAPQATQPGNSSSCALPQYPSASCTGVPVGTKLTVVNGDISVTAANTIIDSKEIHGCVSVHAPGVIIRKSKVFCSGSYVIYSHTDYSGTRLLIEDSEIDCRETNGTAIGDTNITVRRINIHGCENGFDVDGALTVEDSYIHDLFTGNDAHTDGLQITDVGHDIVIRHNAILANGDTTSAIISPSTDISNILIQDNLMAGGAYTLYCRQNGSGKNYRVINNHFSTRYSPKVGAYGPWTDCQDETQVTGNVYHETGKPVPF